MRVGRFVPWLLVTSTAVVGAGIGPVLAQVAVSDPGWPPPTGAECKPSKFDLDLADKLKEAGRVAFDASKYDDAIKLWKDGYIKACSQHDYLKALGRAFEANGQWAAALEVFRLYKVRATPQGDDLERTNGKIESLEKRLGVPKDGPIPTGTAATGVPTATSTPTASATATSTATTSPTTAPTTQPGPSKALPIGLMAGGGAVAIGGVVVWGLFNSKVSSAASDFKKYDCSGVGGAGVNHDQCETIASDGNSAKSTRTIGIVMTGIGVVAAGVGVGLYILGGEKKKDGASVQITPGPGFAGIGLAGSF